MEHLPFIVKIKVKDVIKQCVNLWYYYTNNLIY
jgi:hypothetical protein